MREDLILIIVNKIGLFFLVAIYSLINLFNTCNAATNIAKGKHYTVTPVQNYHLSAPPSDTTSLTDGKYTVGHFWTQKSTVGWQDAKTVEILIDLEKESSIESITFNTARGKEVGVYYPVHIAAFVGPDRDHLQYVGDLADQPENQPGSYKLEKFERNNIGVLGRYVFLVVVSNGFYLFCDEIEVTEGASATSKTGNLSLDQAREFAEQIRRVGIEKRLLIKLIEDLHKMTADLSDDNQLQSIRRKISNIQSVKEAQLLERALLFLRRDFLSKKFIDVPLLVQSIDPWAPFNPVSPLIGSVPSLSLMLPQGGYDSGAVSITNLSTRDQEVSLTIGAYPTGTSIGLYNNTFVKSAAEEYVADPLVPVNSAIVLRPGESRRVFVTAFGKKSGNWNTSLHVSGNNKLFTIPISIRVTHTDINKKISLNSVNWAYLDDNLIRGRQKTAVDDLLAHHTNVVVVPPQYVPIDDPVNPLDFQKLDKYLATQRGASKLLLFAAFASGNRSNVNEKHPFMSQEWKIWFKRWYDDLAKVSLKSGITKENILFYPYDEMNDKHTDEFIAFATWARKEIPDIRLYATIGNKNALRALPYIDVAQIGENEELLRNLVANKPEIWIYRAKGPAKSNSPYSYYRLMAWRAFLSGRNGIGFWAYSDAGLGDNPGTAWDDFDGKYPDYAVIYEGPDNTIISSRRWEAWRMGIEDYELLTMYARTKGDAAAKAMAKDVLDHPEDTTRADAIRRYILQQL